MSLHGKMIELTGADGFVFGAYHVEAQGARKAGLVLIQEIFGVTDHIKEQADRFARVGYEVIAPSIYDRSERGFQTGYSEAGVKRALEVRDAHKLEDGVGDVGACRAALADKGKVFIAGYCFGGSLTWICAARLPGFAAGSAYYGRLIPDHLNELPLCPVICHFGEHDHGIPMELVHKVQAVTAKHEGLETYVYPAGHGFQSDRRRDYHEESDKLAWQRTMELFDAQL